VDVLLPAPIVAPVPRVAVAVTRASMHAPRVPGRVGGTVSAASYSDDDSGVAEIAPLEHIAPIRIAPIAQAGIAPAAIAMPPLNPIAEVHVAPLTPPDGRH
jgi:hypothetical protein